MNTGSPLQVLLVDDDQVDRMVVRRALPAAEAVLTEVIDAQSAIDALHANVYDCVLLDFELPRHRGDSVLKHARAMGLDVPIIVMTGHGHETLAVDLMKAGATDYVSKASFEPKTLLQRIQQAVRLARAERAQRQSEAFLSEIVDNIPALVSYVAADQRLRWANVSYERWFGKPRDEMAGLHLRDLVGEETFRTLEPDVLRALAGEQVNFEHRFGDRWVEGAYVPHRDAANRVEGIFVLLHDVTDRKERADAALRQAEFAEQLLGIVSHDLRNPLSTMILGASILLRRQDLPPDAVRTVQRVIANGELAARLIRDLLDFTRARAGGGIPIEKQTVDLQAIARQTIEGIRTTHPSRRIELDGDGDLTGRFDSDRISQVISNVVINALSYSPPSSIVTVKLSADTTDVAIEVRNDGEPIPASITGVLFQPFKRGSNKDSSTRSIGLGLFIVKQIVDGHRGTIEVDSSAERGTTFVVRLPKMGA